MNSCRIGISRTALFFLVFSSLANSVYAASSWLDKGTSFFNSINKKTSSRSEPADLTTNELSRAFREALNIATDNVVSQLGVLNGFNSNPQIHIPLPATLVPAKKMLEKIGLSSLIDDLELKLNRAAELATPKAKVLFKQAIKDMTFDDVKAIYHGPPDSATKYLQSKMSAPLKEEMAPIIRDSLAQAGAVKAYDLVMSKYQALPFVPDVKANLTEYVEQKGLDAIFYYLAKQEENIRKNPVQQTSDLLQRAFGGK